MQCHYCGRRTVPRSECGAQNHDLARTIDHKIPKAILTQQVRKVGGQDNEVIACARCNAMKGNTPYEVFVDWIETHGPRKALSDQLAYRRHVYNLTLRGLRSPSPGQS